MNVTLPANLCGERALGLLNELGDPDKAEMKIRADELTEIDAWGGAAVRMMIEHHMNQVSVSSPRDKATRPILYGLLKKDSPPHLVLPPDCKKREPLHPAILLQAQPVRSREEADARAVELFERFGGDVRDAASFAAKYLPELVMNALQNPKLGPVPPVACAFLDRDRRELQLVVVDIAPRRPAFNEESLSKKIRAVQAAALCSLAGYVEHRSLDVELRIASGTGRLHWDGSWFEGTAEPVPGFCAAITVRI